MEEFLSARVEELRKQLLTAPTTGERLVLLQEIIAIEERLLRLD